MDLSPAWVKENLKRAKADLLSTEVSYCSLKNKKSKYAEGFRRIIAAKRRVVQVWIEA